MSVIEPTNATETPAASEPVIVPEPKPLDIAEFVHEQYGKHAPADGVTDESKAPEAEEPAAETPEVEPKPVADEPFTNEQLADPKHWDRLDKVGWERAAKLHPVETARVKAGYAAASRIAEEARSKALTSPQTEPEGREEPKPDPWKEAMEMADSLDPQERADGLSRLVDLRLQKKLDEFGIDPSATQASAVERAAYRAAVETMPELAALHEADLNAAVESDPELMDDVQFAIDLTDKDAKIRGLAKVMRRAGQKVIATQAANKAAADAKQVTDAAAAKEAERQKRAKSNQDNPSTIVATSQNGKGPKGERTIEEAIHERSVAATRSA